MKNRLFKFLGLLLVATFCFSCSDEEESLDRIYDLNVIAQDGAESSMNPLKAKVFSQLLNKQVISFSDITTLLIEEQVEYYNKDNPLKPTSTNEVKNWLDYVSTVNDSTDNIEDIKYLFQLQKLDIDNVVYNATATSVPYIMIDKKLQCYSATLLHQLVLRKNFNFLSTHSVVIFEEGHVLSGYMKHRPISDDNPTSFWELIGIENTVKGRGLKIYSSLVDNSSDIRVVDSSLFALIEIFKNDIKNINEVSKQALDLTAKEYDLDPAKINYNYDNILDQDVPESYTANRSPFSFGNVSMDDIDIKLSSYNLVTVPRSSGAGLNQLPEGIFNKDVKHELELKNHKKLEEIKKETQVKKDTEIKQDLEVAFQTLLFNRFSGSYDTGCIEDYSNNGKRRYFTVRVKISKSEILFLKDFYSDRNCNSTIASQEIDYQPASYSTYEHPNDNTWVFSMVINAVGYQYRSTGSSKNYEFDRKVPNSTLQFTLSGSEGSNSVSSLTFENIDEGNVLFSYNLKKVSSRILWDD